MREGRAQLGKWFFIWTPTDFNCTLWMLGGYHRHLSLHKLLMAFSFAPFSLHPATPEILHLSLPLFSGHATGTQEPEKPQSHFHSKVGTTGQGRASGASHNSPNAGQDPSHHHPAARKAVSRAQKGAGKGILPPNRPARQSGEQKGRLSPLETSTPVL